MGITYAETGITYDAHAAVDGALRYAAVDSNIGATVVRKLVKTVKMLADPDMEEYLPRMTETFCEHMFDVCQIIKSIKESEAEEGLKLIAVVRDLFVSHGNGREHRLPSCGTVQCAASEAGGADGG